MKRLEELGIEVVVVAGNDAEVETVDYTGRVDTTEEGSGAVVEEHDGSVVGGCMRMGLDDEDRSENCIGSRWVYGVDDFAEGIEEHCS